MELEIQPGWNYAAQAAFLRWCEKAQELADGPPDRYGVPRELLVLSDYAHGARAVAPNAEQYELFEILSKALYEAAHDGWEGTR